MDNNPNRDLKSKTKSGMIWNAIGNLSSQGVNFIFGIILARILGPESFGIVGMLTIFIVVIGIFIDSGFSQALIYNKSKNKQTDFSTAFYFNIIIGIIGYAALYLSSPYISTFYKLPILTPILKVLGVTLIIKSISIIQQTQFTIKLDFKTPAKITFATTVLSGIIGIILAYNGFGVWSLVYQQLLGAIFNTLLLWFYAKWWPSLEFSFTSLKKLWNYGSKILASGLLSNVYDQINTLVIGKAYNATALGHFSRAQQFAILPSGNLSTIISNVTFPVLSSITDTEEICSIYRKMTKTTCFIVFPLMIGLSLLAEPLIHVLFNEEWYRCVPMLQILSISMMFHPLCMINIVLLKATGHPATMLKLEIIKKWIIGLLVIFITINISVLALCWGNLFYMIISFLINALSISRILKLNFFDQVLDIVPILINSIVMGGCVYISTIIIHSEILRLVIGTAIGMAYYYLTSKKIMPDEIEHALYFFKRG